MVFFNYSTKEITGKIVYYGPGLCGKTTNLQYIYRKLDPNTKGKMLSLATENDRTLFFDFLPVKLGTIRGMKIRFQLYTVPGQVFYNETRKLVLKGCDAVVFVADSQQTLLEANEESYRNMEENLRYNGLDPESIPLLLQYNKRDLSDISSIEELNEALNVRNVPIEEAIATEGKGVIETFQKIGKILMNEIVKKHKLKGTKKKKKEHEVEQVDHHRKQIKTSKSEVDIEEDRHLLELQDDVPHELKDETFDDKKVSEVELEPVKEEEVVIETASAREAPSKSSKFEKKLKTELSELKPQKRKEASKKEMKTVPSKPKLKDVSSAATSVDVDLSEVLKTIKGLSDEIASLKSGFRDIQQLQKQIMQDIEKNSQEIISTRPEIVQSWFSKKIFKLNQ